jgi:hypothetical protein
LPQEAKRRRCTTADVDCLPGSVVTIRAIKVG